MWRRILGIVVGIVVAQLLVIALELAGHHFFPPPPGLMEAFAAHDRAKAAELIVQLPAGAFASVAAAYAIATVVGALVAGWIAARPASAIVTGGVMLCLVAINFYQIPHPLWFAAVSLLVTAAGAALAWLLLKRCRPATT